MSEFAICIANTSNSASVVARKVYRNKSDAQTQTRNLLQVVDEDQSEPNGYLYPTSMFASIELPEAVYRALSVADTQS